MYLKTAIILGIFFQITSVIYLVLFNYGLFLHPPSNLTLALPHSSLYKSCVKAWAIKKKGQFHVFDQLKSQR